MAVPDGALRRRTGPGEPPGDRSPREPVVVFYLRT